VPDGFEIRTDHGPRYTEATSDEFSKAWNVDDTVAPVGRPTGNAVAERVIQTMKEEYIWLRDRVSLKDLEAALAVWQSEYNERRPHQALHWSTPSERRQERLGSTMRLAARPSRAPAQPISRRPILLTDGEHSNCVSTFCTCPAAHEVGAFVRGFAAIFAQAGTPKSFRSAQLAFQQLLHGSSACAGISHNTVTNASIDIANTPGFSLLPRDRDVFAICRKSLARVRRQATNPAEIPSSASIACAADSSPSECSRAGPLSA
jgi:putative transposase